MIRVVIADDHAIVRRGMRQVLEEAGDVQVVGEASGYAELSALLRERDCDVLVLDIAMPQKDGMDVLRSVRALHPRVHVLMVSMYPEEQYALRALRAGAAGYLNKASAPEKLREAVRAVALGRRYLTAEVAELLAERMTHPSERPPHELLSDREFQTLRLIASGRKLSEIAAALALSPKTVSVYRARVLAKIGARSNAELTRYAIENRLLD